MITGFYITTCVDKKETEKIRQIDACLEGLVQQHSAQKYQVKDPNGTYSWLSTEKGEKNSGDDHATVFYIPQTLRIERRFINPRETFQFIAYTLSPAKNESTQYQQTVETIEQIIGKMMNNASIKPDYCLAHIDPNAQQ
jgi:hypothetical protein